MNVSIIGSGYVGLVTGARLAHFGVNVLCMDNDVDRIAQLEKGEVPFYEPGLMELVSKTMSAGRLSFTSNLHCAVTRSLVIIIAVDTPQKQDGSADLQYVESVCRQIGYYLDEYKLIVTKSTVPVGT